MNVQQSTTSTAAVARRGPASQAVGRTVRVLCVEANQAIGSIFQLFLERAGYEVTLVEDCEHAWRLLMSRGADLLLTEYRMPLSTGPEFVGRVRAAGMRLPIILVLGSLESLEGWERKKLDVSGILLRPFTQEQLLSTVKTALTRRSGSKHSRGIRLGVDNKPGEEGL